MIVALVSLFAAIMPKSGGRNKFMRLSCKRSAQTLFVVAECVPALCNLA